MHKALRAGGALLLLGAILIAASGCVSTQKRYEKALDREARGQYAEAAALYVKVLQREPHREEARTRLRDVGARAIDACLREAEAAERAAAYEQALRALDRLDALRARTATVGVRLPAPDAYTAYRKTLTEGAYASVVRQGEGAEQAGRWTDALHAYERAGRYASTEAQHTTVTEARARVFVRWGEQELARRRYRSAYAQAEQAAVLLNAAHPLRARARALQEVALEQGTRVVAFLPLWRTDTAARSAPPAWLGDLNDALLLDHWLKPPRFLAPHDPLDLRRALRSLRYDRLVLTHRQAAEAGRFMEADYVVLGELVTFDRAERNLEEERRTAPLRRRGATLAGHDARRDTTYVIQRYELTLTAEVSYRVVDVRRHRVIDEGTVALSVEEAFRRGLYAGDPRTLDLSGSDLRLLDEGAQREDERVLADALSIALAERIAAHVFDDVLRHIP